MADSTKNGGDQTKFEINYQNRIKEIADKYQDPTVRDAFPQLVKSFKEIIKDTADCPHDYGLQLTRAVGLVEKICNGDEVTRTENIKQKTALELKVKELEGKILHYGVDSGKLAEERKRLELLYAEIEQRQAMLALMSEAVENERNKVYCDKRDFYELAMQVRELFGKFVEANKVPVDAEHKDLPEKIKLAIKQLVLTPAEQEFLQRRAGKKH